MRYKNSQDTRALWQKNEIKVTKIGKEVNYLYSQLTWSVYGKPDESTQKKQKTKRLTNKWIHQDSRIKNQHVEFKFYMLAVNDLT